MFLDQTPLNHPFGPSQSYLSIISLISAAAMVGDQLSMSSAQFQAVQSDST